MNTINISGHLTADPEIRTVNNGDTVLNFSIAWNKSIKRGETYESVPHFFSCVYWPKNVQYWCKELRKGRQVFLSGELNQDRWEQDGQNRQKVKLNARVIDLGRMPQGSSAPPQHKSESYKPEDFEDDIPF